MEDTKNMSRRSFIAAGAMSALACCGVAAGALADEEPADEATEGEQAGAEEGAGGYQQLGEYTLLPFKHYASGGVEDDLNAIILFENKNSTFTRYQVAFTSCTCRDAASNYRSVMYVELLNNKDTADEAKIRQLLFTQNEGYNVGFWGDSNPIHGQPDYTQEYMDENFVQKLVGLTIADVNGWGGYGTQLGAIDVDAVTGATVSTSNIMSVLQALCAYHTQKYYA